MIEPIQKASEDFQKMSKDNFDATVRSYAELNKGFQAIAAKMTDYSKQAFEDATRAFEQLASAKSLESVFEIQSQYAKKAYDTWVSRGIEARRDVCCRRPRCLQAGRAGRCQDRAQGSSRLLSSTKTRGSHLRVFVCLPHLLKRRSANWRPLAVVG